MTETPLTWLDADGVRPNAPHCAHTRALDQKGTDLAMALGRYVLAHGTPATGLYAQDESWLSSGDRKWKVDIVYRITPEGAKPDAGPAEH